MTGPRLRRTVWVASTTLIAAALLGCFQAAPTPAPPAPPPQPDVQVPPPKQEGEASAGRKVFDANRCAMCHTIAGPGGVKGKGKGPELTTVGAKRERAWIIEHVRNPLTH